MKPRLSPLFPRFAVLLLLAAFPACTTVHETAGALGIPMTPGAAQEPAQTPVGAAASAGSRKGVLDRETAFRRARQVQKVRYQLQFKLDDEAPEFFGKARIQFELRPRASDPGSPLQFDFGGGRVLSLEVNGKPIGAGEARITPEKVLLPLDLLRPNDQNEVVFGFAHPYSNDGAGLHRFKDPEDGRTYLYTQMEPFDANRVFPCFDQPDLKGTYELSVETPEAWQVIANARETEVRRVEGRKRWAFPVSAPFSTYLFALHAGPYATWRSKAGDVPLRLFARRSLAQDVDPDEWFEITRKGLDYYGLQFGVDYPYQKYDQVIVPEFNAGAMENVAAVTFSERAVFRTRVTQDRRRHRAETILHEMAHMWFGDLVTMHWWNGLWLNESFATFMAVTATDKTTRFKGSWESFFAGDKRWGYWEDQLVTTHPIEQPVRDTVEAETSFDGVTYGKGAAVLKQLHHYIGEDDFREGIQRYIEKFSGKNTTLGDFIQSLSEASGRNLSKWQKAWLQTSGMNTVRAECKCAPDPDTGQSVIQTLTVVQAADEASQGLLRPHRAEVALFRSGRGTGGRPSALDRYADFPVTYSGARTDVPEAEGEPCPELAFPNHGDYDYVKIDLDEASLKVVLKRLRFIDDLLTRHVLWQTLWQRVVDGKLAAQDYIEAALAHLPHERDTLLLSTVLGTLASRHANERTALGYLPEEARAHYLLKIENLLKTRLATAAPGSDLQLVWWHAFRAAASPRQDAWLKRLLDGKASLAGIPMDRERRWEAILALAGNGYKAIAKLIADELRKDPSDRGRKKADGAEAASEDEALRALWTARILKEGGEPLPVSRLREAMGSFHVLDRPEDTRKFAARYFDSFARLNEAKELQDAEYAASLASEAFPALCEESVVTRARDLLRSHKDLPATATKGLRISIQEEERCIRARALSATEWAATHPRKEESKPDVTPAPAKP